MKRLLFICLMIISSLFVFADNGKTTCRVTGDGDIIATILSPIVTANSMGKNTFVDCELKLTAPSEKTVTVVIIVLDSNGDTVATDTFTFLPGSTYGSVRINSGNIQYGERYKLRISSASCQ